MTFVSFLDFLYDHDACVPARDWLYAYQDAHPDDSVAEILDAVPWSDWREWVLLLCEVEFTEEIAKAALAVVAPLWDPALGPLTDVGIRKFDDHRYNAIAWAQKVYNMGRWAATVGNAIHATSFFEDNEALDARLSSFNDLLRTTYPGTTLVAALEKMGYE